MGQHGWYAFWKAALGQYDDSIITYSGTVTPVAMVPDYERWSQYGGDLELHSFKQVPRDVLISLPLYTQSEQRMSYEDSPRSDVYSVGNMGSYDTGAEGDGSHIGVDIRVPEGTPVRAVMNGIVERVAEDPGGFGKLIVIRHPHAPNPDDPRYETVLHSAYAHLSEQMVAEGDIVQKGQTIAYSGQTGYATGPHLHFQIDRDEAQWHPYWAFSTTEARDAGMNTTQAINAGLFSERGRELTVNPLLYVQSNFAPATFQDETSKTTVRVTSKTMTASERRAARIAQRVAAHTRDREQLVVVQPAAVQVVAPTNSSVASIPLPSIVQVETVATATPIPSQTSSTVRPVVSVAIQNPSEYGERQWLTVRITLLDIAGEVTDAKGLSGKLYLRTAYGDAEYEPSTLTAANFKDGVATVRMLPRGTQTVVILVEPIKSMSKPIPFAGR